MIKMISILAAGFMLYVIVLIKVIKWGNRRALNRKRVPFETRGIDYHPMQDGV